MNCKEVKLNLVDYASGKLKSVEIEKHLKECESCKFEFQQIADVVSALNELNFDEPSEFYWSNFLGRVKRKIAERGSAKVFALKPVLFAPSIAVIIIGFIFGFVFSNLNLGLSDFYAYHYDVEKWGVFVKPEEIQSSEFSDELIEEVISYLYEKYQLPEIDKARLNYQEVDIDEILQRLSNKF
jgi:hypothetical protein